MIFHYRETIECPQWKVANNLELINNPSTNLISTSRSSKTFVENKSIQTETTNDKTTGDKINKNVAEMSMTFIKSTEKETTIAPLTFGDGCENKEHNNDEGRLSSDNNDLSKS